MSSINNKEKLIVKQGKDNYKEVIRFQVFKDSERNHGFTIKLKAMNRLTETDCEIVYTEDMQHGQLIENKLKILNPFPAE